MITLDQLETITGKTVLDYLDRSMEVPQITAAACQGDVSIFRRDNMTPATTPMPKTVMVVRSEASSNTHTLHPNGECFFDYNPDASVTNLTIGTLTVAEGSSAFMSHQEHGGIEIMPGTYRIGRQREFQGEWQMVAD